MVSLPPSKVTLLYLANTPANPAFTKVFEPFLNSINPFPCGVFLSNPIPVPALSILVLPSVENVLITLIPLRRVPSPFLSRNCLKISPLLIVPLNCFFNFKFPFFCIIKPLKVDSKDIPASSFVEFSISTSRVAPSPIFTSADNPPFITIPFVFFPFTFKWEFFPNFNLLTVVTFPFPSKVFSVLSPSFKSFHWTPYSENEVKHNNKTIFQNIFFINISFLKY